MMDDELIIRYHAVIAKAILKTNYGAWAMDVAQEMVLELLRQPKTRAYVRKHADRIRQNRLPGKRLKMRAIHLANQMSVSVRNSVEDDTADQTKDHRWERDCSRSEAKLIIEDLAEQEPWIARARDAYAAGYETRSKLASQLGIGERTLYNWRDKICNRY